MVRPSVKSWLIPVALILIFIACAPRGARPTPDKGHSLAQSISDKTRLWLLKQARARLGGKDAEQQSAPREAEESRRTTLFITAFTRGQPAPPAIGSGDSLAQALKAAPMKGKQTPDQIQIDVLDGSLAPLDKPLRSEHDD